MTGLERGAVRASCIAKAFQLVKSGMFKSSMGFVEFYGSANKMGKLTHFTFCFFFFFLFILYCSTINSSFKCCYWSFFVKILPLPCPQPLMLLQCTQLDAGRMSSTAGPALRRHKGVWGVCACRKGMRETEYMCVLSLIRKFNWMEFGSFPPPPPLELAAINRLFSLPFILQWFVVLHLLCWHCLC